MADASADIPKSDPLPDDVAMCLDYKPNHDAHARLLAYLNDRYLPDSPFLWIRKRQTGARYVLAKALLDYIVQREGGSIDFVGCGREDMADQFKDFLMKNGYDILRHTQAPISYWDCTTLVTDDTYVRVGVAPNEHDGLDGNQHWPTVMVYTGKENMQPVQGHVIVLVDPSIADNLVHEEPYVSSPENVLDDREVENPSWLLNEPPKAP